MKKSIILMLNLKKINLQCIKSCKIAKLKFVKELENSIVYDIISDPEELKKFKRNLEFNMKK